MVLSFCLERYPLLQIKIKLEACERIRLLELKRTHGVRRKGPVGGASTAISSACCGTNCCCHSTGYGANAIAVGYEA